MRGSSKAFVLTGTPGTGKTSLSRILKATLRLNIIRVNELVISEKLYSGYDDVRGTYITNIAKTKRRIDGLVRVSSDKVMVEGHIAHLVTPSRLVEATIVLRCHPLILEERLRLRGYQTGKTRENVLAELLDLCFAETLDAYGPGRVAEIDTTYRTPDEVAEEALLVLKGGERRLHVVDWISLLDSEGSLTRLLA